MRIPLSPKKPLHTVILLVRIHRCFDFIGIGNPLELSRGFIPRQEVTDAYCFFVQWLDTLGLEVKGDAGLMIGVGVYGGLSIWRGVRCPPLVGFRCPRRP